MPLSEGATRARQARRLLQRVLEFAPDGVDLRTVVRIGRRAAEGIVELAAEEEADLIIFGWGGRPAGSPGGWRRAGVQPHHRRGACATRRATSRSSSSAASPEVRRILAPVRGGPHAELALRFAAALGASFDAEVDALHVVAAGPRPDAPCPRPSERSRCSSASTRGETPRPSVMVERRRRRRRSCARPPSADLVVMGASVVGAGRRLAVRASCRRRSRRAAGPTVIVVRPARPPRARRSSSAPPRRRPWRPRSVPRPPAAACPPGSTAGSPSRASTTPSSPTSGACVELKEKQGLTISAVLPTLNEAETIGPIVRAARIELMEKVPLIDELLVIDSDSDDDTRELARGRGRPRRPALRGAAALRLAIGARARRSGRASTRPPATWSCGPTRTSGTGTRASCTARSGRC